uniref:Uncharacterized protein n=1 Tax=Rhizophora mucronata TaxID=61149 RepID=A0A2P2IHL0_RHIMU
MKGTTFPMKGSGLRGGYPLRLVSPCHVPLNAVDGAGLLCHLNLYLS